MSSILIKNGRIVTASDSFAADILVIEDKIKGIGKDLEAVDSNTEVIDASGLYVLPGGIDAHVHMELPLGDGLFSCDDFESGTRAALAGGTTSIIDFVTPQRGQSLIEAVEERKKLAEKSLCHYRLHMSVTEWNPRVPAEMKQCLEQEGMTSVKVYMAYKESVGLDDGELLQVMETAAGLGLLVMVHCEHGEAVGFLQKKFIREGKTGPRYHPLSRPPEVEGEAVNRALMMAKITCCPIYIVHVSTREAVERIAGARETGRQVFAETCPHYLLLDDSEYKRPGFAGAAYVMSPPLRPKGHGDALWKAIKNGVIQTAATDHCPFHMKDRKERGRDDFTRIPNGVAGVEHRMVLLYRYGVLENKITLKQFVDITAEQPARIFGLYPQKGTIAVGSDADILLWDPQAEDVISAATHVQHCDTTIYEGFPIKGKPYIVIAGGKQITFAAGKGKNPT